MIDKKALTQKLNSLADTTSRFEDGARVIGEGDLALKAILNVIDETVLERKLTFQIGKAYVTVVAGGRRLQGVTKLSGDLDGALKVMGKVLSHDDAEVLESVAHVMNQFGERTGTLTLRTEVSDKIGGQTDAGVGITTLAEAWGVDMSSEPPTPLGQFIINCGASVNASLVIAQGEIVRAKGDKAIQDKLEGIANDQWSAFEDAHAKLRKQEQQEPTLVCLNTGLGDDTSIAVAKKDAEVSVFVFNSNKLGDVYSAWRKSAA